MGKGKQPTYEPPKPIPVPTADELFQSGKSFAQKEMPGAYGARESALNDLNNPNYYSSFQPTSFEQALGNQQFQNIWPDQEAYMRNALSQSGMAYSPVAATTLGNARGNLGYQIGSYLADQGNNRATNSLNARLGIDPMSQILNPYVGVGQDQGNQNTMMQNQYNQQLAQAQYQQAMNKANQRSGMIGTLGTLGGAALGTVMFPGMGTMAGASLGASLGGAGSSLFGGPAGQGGNLGQALASYQMMNRGQPVNPGMQSSYPGLIMG